jgi:hypothetical protein
LIGQLELIEPDFFHRRNICRLRSRKTYDFGLLPDLVRPDHDLMKALWRRRHGTILRLRPKGMGRINREIQLHGVWIDRAAAPRAMLLHPRNYLLPPGQIGRRAMCSRSNGRRSGREARSVAVNHFMVKKGRGVPLTMNARERLTANRASHEQVRRFRQEREYSLTGPGFAFKNLPC